MDDAKQKLKCSHEGCTRDDLRGEIGKSMHERRAHGANWSTVASRNAHPENGGDAK